MDFSYQGYKATDKYFAADKPDKAIAYIHMKAGSWFNNYMENNLIYKIKMSWEAYHGAYYLDGHKITYGGDQGELVNLPINHYRNIAQIMLNMVTANRPAFQARSTNLDAKSEVQTNLANGLLEYYMREKRLESTFKKAVEFAVVLGSAFIKLGWNATSGKIYDYIEPEEKINPTTGEENKPYPIYEGDATFDLLSPYDIIFDTSKAEWSKQQWVLIRTFQNKYDLAAKYPEYADKILKLKTKSDMDSKRFFLYPYDETTDVPVYEFMHKPSEALPEGRYLYYIDDEIILGDTVLPFKELPVYRITPSDFLGTPFGYTPMFDLLAPQSAINSLYSTILTNQNAFGVQNILNPRGNDVQVHQIGGGLNFIEYNAQFGKPEPLNLTYTPPEVFNFINMLEKAMETTSGMNSVVRGNPDAALKSGNALALVQSQALQFISGLQQSYIQLIEDVGTGLINILRDFAMVPRIAAIVGINNRSKMAEFTGDDLSTVNRVLIDVGNALSQTTAGRVQMAEQMLQMKIIDSPEKYIEVMNTGKLTALDGGQNNELLLIRSENEHLMSGDYLVQGIFSDKHSLHIREHRTVLADPKLRHEDPELIQRVSAHIQEHVSLLQNTDPNILAIFGENPLAPPGGTPAAPGTMAPEMPQMPAEMPGANPNAQLPQPAKPAVAPQGSTAFELPLTSGR